MKKLLALLFIFAVLILSTIGSELIKPYTSYFTQKVIDTDNPFNFKNEYELLIFQNEQKEVQETIKSVLNGLNFNIEDKDAFAACVIDNNLTALNKLNLNNSRLNPMNPKTVEGLGDILQEYQPLMIKVQTESIKTCIPQKEVDKRPAITLSCACTNVKLNAPSFQSLEYKCGDGFVDGLAGVTVDFQKKELNYKGTPYKLMEDDNFYYGIDILTKMAVDKKLRKHKASLGLKEDVEDFHQIANADIKLERLTGSLEYNRYWGWTGMVDDVFWTTHSTLFPSMTAVSQCRFAEKF